ncbi:MAG: DNA primase [Parcubacteria group bacterium Gr01-1014_38]|nr:MAG: DNA primase [Parcubacteria group bacterium Gr01-1014_38]
MERAPTDRIKERIDIVALIGESLPLKRAGSNFKARCPFHEEDTPSFMVSPTRQMFHCFGCGESGDVFSWLMKREGMTFPEALRVLAQKAGVPLTFERPEHREEKERLRETLDLAVTFYQRILLNTADGRAARAYLEERGLTPATIQDWRLGYCPPSATPITLKAGERGIAEQDLLRAGILHQGQSRLPGGQSRTFEFFHGRILFPLTDAHGSVVGLAGRVFESGDASAFAKATADRPKYINSPETALYTKSRILYGLDRAKDAVRKENLAVLVEGYTDVILSHQVGITNVVATSGTALTENHLQLLRRFTDRLALAFDADAGGDAATRRAVDLALAAGFLISVVVLPNDRDPADLAAENPHGWREAVRQREDMFSFFLQRAQKTYGTNSPEGKKAVAADLLPLIARVNDQVVAGEYAQQLASVLRIDPRFIYEDLKRFSAPSGRPSVPAAAASLRSALDPHVEREERFLVLLLADPELIPKAAEILPDAALETPHARTLYTALKGWYTPKRAQHGGPKDAPSARAHRGDEHTPPGPLARLRDILPDDLRRSLDILAFTVEVEREREEWDPPREALILVRELLLASLRRNLRLRTEQLRAAPAAERGTLLREIAAVTADLARAERVEW